MISTNRNSQKLRCKSTFQTQVRKSSSHKLADLIYNFNPGPITLTYAVSARFDDGYFHVYNFDATAFLTEYGPMMVCFPVNIPNRYITSVKVCTDRTTTDYVVDEVVGEKVYLDMVVPEEATIGGHFFKADPAPLGPMGCQGLWKIQYNEERHYIPKWVSCQDDISVIFHEDFNLNFQDNSNIYLQLAVHEYPIVYTDYPIVHQQVYNYQNGDSINISGMLQEIDPGRRYVLSIATLCWEDDLRAKKISRVVAKANKVRTLIFDYEAKKTWVGYIDLGNQGDEWDNAFPGKIDYSSAPITFITPDNYNSGANFKYEIIRLTSNGEEDQTLYQSDFIPGDEFFASSGENRHTFVRLNGKTQGYFFTSQNEYFVVRVTTDDVCDYTIRSVYFRTGDGSNSPPDYGAHAGDEAISRSIQPNSAVTLYGNPSTILNFDYQTNSTNTTQFYIFNNTGRQILSQGIEEGNVQIHDSSGWATGLYYIVIKSDDEILTEKWIKQ